tara:strand:- start:809 stop:1144 length:336 start_codon:yes stop_codon:yes gene_type:complete
MYEIASAKDNYERVCGFAPGCYVDGSRGIYAISHLVLNVLDEFATEDDKLIMRNYEEDPYQEDLWVGEVVEKVEARFNEFLGTYGLTSCWHDGDFMIMTEEEAIEMFGGWG